MPCDAASANTSVGTSLAASLTTAPTAASREHSLAEYHKKDVTIWNRVDHVEKQICVRVQVWVMNLHPASTEDAESSSHSINSNYSNSCVHNAPLLALLTRCHCIIVTLCCPSPVSTFTFDSSASMSSSEWNAISHDQNNSNWPQLNELEHTIHQWVIFLRNAYDKEVNNDGKKENGLSISVVLTQADRIISIYSTQHWIALSLCMQRVCHRMGIESWRFGSCVDTSRQIDVENMDGIEQLPEHQRFIKRMQMEETRRLQDMNEAVESAFVESIQLFLDRT